VRYIIEHLDKKLYTWCFLEYKHAASVVGKEKVIFTNVHGPASQAKLSEFGAVFGTSVCKIVSDTNAEGLKDIKEILSKKICVLDPFAEKTLVSDDRRNFDVLIFGGIMGDYPPQKRTGGFCDRLKERGIKFETRNLGKEQMSTDTAVIVANKIVADGEKLENMKFKDTIIIPICKGEEVELPFRYLLDEKNEPMLPPGLVEFLKKMKGF
jgi:ribosome biogenesis SPOUT family RNA methylase Rps3